MGEGGLYWIRSVRPSPNSCPLYNSFPNGRISLTHSPQLGDVQSPCCPCVSSRSRSQLKVKYLTNKYYTLCHVRSITPLLMEGFPSNLNDTFTSTRWCAKPMCQLKVKVTLKCQILNKQILDFMSCPLYKPYTNGRISLDVQSPCCPCVSSRSRSHLKSNIKQTNIRHYVMSAL